MKLLDFLTVTSATQEHRIELYHGDLCDMPPEHAVDVLVISAFPGDYIPSRSSVIGALHNKGISVQELSHHKAVDLRQNFSSWISDPIPAGIPGIQFNRIICFEPLLRANVAEVIGDVFQALMPFVVTDPPITSIAMSLLTTGNRGVAMVSVLEPLIEAAVNWLALGLPVKTIKIVQHNEAKAWELKGAFGQLKQKYLAPSPTAEHGKAFKYDFFISYSHKNSDEVMDLYNELMRLKPNLRIFLDRTNLNTGSAWQQELYEALDECRKVIVVYSPPYLTSKVCKEEFNIAMLRHREADGNVLLPIYLYSAPLPTYMQLIQFIDCREGNAEKLKAACRQLVS